MKVYNFTVVLMLAMISALHCIPIEVVYTGDSCDCPKALKYVVNVPPPPETKEYTRCEHGYRLDVPVPTKAKVTYSFDFTVQEPKPPAPVEDERWNLYAKVDRITAQKQDCTASTQGGSTSTCGCNSCVDSRNSRYRYVSPTVESAAILRRSPQNSGHPNSVSKREKRKPLTTLAWAAIIKPLNEKSSVDVASMLRSRRKRGLTSLFGLNRRMLNVKRPERLVKQYHKRLEAPTTTTAKPILGQHFKAMPNLAGGVGGGRRPFEHLRNLIMSPRSRNKRDIKGEYDLIEKEREELDLTLPEIIQFMPETLDPNFKRGQCQFGCHSEQAHQEELLHRVESNNIPEETTSTTVDALSTEATTEQTDSDNETDDSDNDISSSSHTKRQAERYGYAYTQPFDHTPPSHIGYSLQPYAPTPDSITRPFSYHITDSPYGPDPAPQQYVGAPQVYAHTTPIPASHARSMHEDGPIYHPGSHGFYAGYSDLDRIIADIISRHSDFIEATTHKGGALVDPSADQEHQTKSLLKTLVGGRLHHWFGEEAPQQDDRYAYGPPHVYQHYPYSSSAYQQPSYK